MDVESHNISVDLSQPNLLDRLSNGSPINHSITPSICTLCRIMPSADTFPYVNSGTVGICGHCKFLLLEDLGTPTTDLHRRRLHRGRRSIRSSSESIEDFFSQQFSQMMNMARQNQSLVSEHHDPPEDTDVISRFLQQTSSLSTPDGSGRWRRMSDTDSDVFDNMDSLYGETESNISFGARIFQGDSDTVSVGFYGGDSDISTEDHSFLEMGTFAHSIVRGDLDSDFDIDPMHAGLITWGSDGHDDIEEEYGSEEADVEETAAELLGARFPSETRIMERRYGPISTIFSNLDESGDVNFHGNNRDPVNVRVFDELLEHLDETDNSRRSAPPASESFVSSLPRLVLNENQKKSDEVTCAICKDLLLFGSEAIQLPCLHLYHPCCILPWLGRSNSCPLCRHELPTDDMDYEDGKLNANARSRNSMYVHEIQQQDSSSDVSDPVEMVEAEMEIWQEIGNFNNAMNENDTDQTGERGRWSFRAAAPIVSLLGIVLVVWLGKPVRLTQINCHDPSQTLSCSENQRESRKWWRWF